MDTLKIFLTIFSRMLMLFLILPITNSVKGLVAKALGDDTADREGRITLNPIAHLDMLGSIAIILIGFGWSKPLPINYNRMKNLRQGIIIMSLTAPLTYFLLAIICANIAEVMYYTVDLRQAASFAIYTILSILAQISVCLGTIHLLPIPSMDGFTLLYQFAGSKFRNWYHSNYQAINHYSSYAILILFFIGSLTNGLIDPLGWLIGLMSWLINLTTLWIPAVFG